MRRKRPGIINRNDGILLRRIAQAGGLIVTQHANDGVAYTLRASGERIRPEVVQRLINSRVLLAEDRGLFDLHPQTFRTRTPADGKP